MNGRGDYKGKGRYKEAFGAFKGAQNYEKSMNLRTAIRRAREEECMYEWKR